MGFFWLDRRRSALKKKKKRKSLSLSDEVTWLVGGVLEFSHWPLLFQNEKAGTVLYANEPVQRDASGSRNLYQAVKLEWNQIQKWHGLFLA